MATSARRSREKLQRRDAILDAAERVFSDRGFAAVTMDDVAAAAELSKGALYLYFRSKDALFVALTGRTMEPLAARLEAAAATATTGRDALRAVLLAYADFAIHNERRFRGAMQWIVSDHAIDLDAPSFASHRAATGRILGCFAGVVGRGVADHSLRADLDPRRTAGQLWSGMIGNLIIRINIERLAHAVPADQVELDHDRFVSGFVDLLVAGLASDRAGSGKAATAARSSKAAPAARSNKTATAARSNKTTAARSNKTAATTPTSEATSRSRSSKRRRP